MSINVDIILYYILSLRQQIDTHEEALTKMIETLTPEKMDRLRTTVEYLWGKSYSNEVFNQSTLNKSRGRTNATIRRTHQRTTGKISKTLGKPRGQIVISNYKRSPRPMFDETMSKINLGLQNIFNQSINAFYDKSKADKISYCPKCGVSKTPLIVKIAPHIP